MHCTIYILKQNNPINGVRGPRYNISGNTQAESNETEPQTIYLQKQKRFLISTFSSVLVHGLR